MLVSKFFLTSYPDTGIVLTAVNFGHLPEQGGDFFNVNNPSQDHISWSHCWSALHLLHRFKQPFEHIYISVLRHFVGVSLFPGLGIELLLGTSLLSAPNHSIADLFPVP